MCGCNSGSGGAVASVMENPAREPVDPTVYVVTYFNGVTEEATGLDAVRNLLINPAARVEGAREQEDFSGLAVPLYGGTYAPKK